VKTCPPFPQGLKPGDFIQTSSHFGDIFFEVLYCIAPSEGSNYWQVTFATYDKYSGTLRTDWVNSASTIRAVVSAEMAGPVIMAKHQRYKATWGQYDPFYGFAPVGTPLRNRGD
jgi:hypothetical protein